MKYNNVDFDTYFKNYPDANGFFGKYGGSYIPEDLQKAMEEIIPAIESSHAVAYAMKLAKKMGKGSILINLSGRGDKDMDYIIEKYGIR